MVWEASKWDFDKKEAFFFRLLQFAMDNEGNQEKCEEVCEPWNEFCTAKLKEVIQSGRDAFAWQKKPEALKGMDFNQWLKPRHFALGDHYCGKSAAMRTHDSNQATRPPRATRFTLVCVDSNWTRMAEAQVEGAQGAICALLTPFITYKHTLQHTNRLRCPSRL